MAGEAERNRMNSIFRLMVEQASDTLMLHSEDGRVLYASPNLQRSIGLTPEDIARAAVYLIQSDFVTGEVLSVDGGQRLV